MIKAKSNIFRKKNINNIETKKNHFNKSKTVIKKYNKIRKPIILKRKGNPPKRNKTTKTKGIKLIKNYGSTIKLIPIKSNFSKTKSNSEKQNILGYNDRELNLLEYKEALIRDKRTYCQYYISLLKISHLLIFSFYINNKDYNSQIIKIFLFFFFFAVHFTINALFFNDDTMHKIYKEEGKFNFIYQIPIIFYSSLISGVINAIIKYFALTESLILEIKKQTIIKNFEIKRKDIINRIKIRIALFFIITFFLLLLCMYYISCFCYVYSNTQLHLIKDSIMSFVLSLIYPFGLLLIPGIFRLSALSSKDRNQECLYKFSNLIEMILA